MEPTTTIVLPVHNAERTLRAALLEIIELIDATRRRLQVVVVDDGSTDGTFETACELATQYPQICVFRQPVQRGMGAALECVRQRLGVREVIAHDGVGSIKASELESLLRSPKPLAAAAWSGAEPSADQRGSRRFGAATALHARLAEAHRWVASFQWLRVEEPPAPRRKASAQFRQEGAATMIAPLDNACANTCTLAPFAL